MGVVKRPLFTFFLPSTMISRLRRVSFAAPVILFGVSAGAIVSKQSYYRTMLDDEAFDTCDRIERRAYVALPDGRMALVYPIVYPSVSPCTVWEGVKEMFSLMP